MSNAVEIKREIYRRIGDAPVMICCLEMADGTFAIGFHVSSPEKFDEEISAIFARRKAEDAFQKIQINRAARALERSGSV